MTSIERQRDALKRQAIFDLQEMLKTISMFEEEELKLLPDGIFGVETENAVKNFQNRYNLEQNGEADYSTWQAISKRYNEVILQIGPAQFIDVHKGDFKEIKMGDSDDRVYMLQIMFNSLGDEFKTFKKCVVSGNFNNTDFENVKQFQKISGQNQSGIVDKITWDKIAKYYNMF